MKVAVLLSGGVDSSVALALLKEQGHDLTAFYLKVWLEDELSYLGECPWEEDLAMARAVSELLEVPLEIRSLQKEYWDRVVRYTIDELQAGRTPSPDVFCNQRIKFGAFADNIDESFEKIGSGHYARLEDRNGTFGLKRGIDPVKDQSYFLSHMFPSQLERGLFPVGHLAKSEVRDLADSFALPNCDRKDSQGICFLGKIQYREFVKFHLGERPGDVIDAHTGKALGQHRGYWFHTIGQRQGLGLAGGPWFVQGKDIDANILYVSHGDRLQESAKHECKVANLHWLGEPPGARSLDVQVKVRHGPRLISATLEWNSTEGKVRLDEPEPGLAPGQFTVFYDGEWCLGGATIC